MGRKRREALGSRDWGSHLGNWDDDLHERDLGWEIRGMGNLGGGITSTGNYVRNWEEGICFCKRSTRGHSLGTRSGGELAVKVTGGGVQILLGGKEGLSTKDHVPRLPATCKRECFKKSRKTSFQEVAGWRFTEELERGKGGEGGSAPSAKS